MMDFMMSHQRVPRLAVIVWLTVGLVYLSAQAQDKTVPDKRVIVPVRPITKATPPPASKEPAVKVFDGKVLDGVKGQKPPKITQKPPKTKSKTAAYGIRPPVNPEPENPKPAARMGIRPPITEVEEEPKASGKGKKSGGETTAKKTKEDKPKKTVTPDKSQPAAAPLVNEPAPAATVPTNNQPGNTLMNEPLGDPKFGTSGGANVSSSGSETGFLNRVVTVGNVAYRYQVFVPRNWNRRQALPVILFLHGAGERGEDGLLQTEVGLGTAIRRDVARFPALVVFPQCRKNIYWPDDAMQAQALAALEQSIREFNGDRARLYLTGISMGGFGTWALAASHAGMFAAYAPVCGALKANTGQMVVNIKADDPYTVVARLVGQTPTWIFHGGDDKVVLTEESRKMHEALKAVGGNVQYTEYPGVSHNSWDKAYAEPKLMEWLLSQRLKK